MLWMHSVENLSKKKRYQVQKMSVEHDRNVVRLSLALKWKEGTNILLCKVMVPSIYHVKAMNKGRQA